jgi:hypothetical protein
VYIRDVGPTLDTGGTDMYHDYQLITSRPKSGWRIPQWSEETGLSRSTVYNLLDAKAIESVKAGKCRIIVTPPSQYLESLKS